jgi:hybrid cluster-associated redox disulfide protein
MTKTAGPDGRADVPRLDQPVEEIMGRWPATARVFMHRKMACVGCIMAPFQTLAAAARAYHIAEGELLSEIRNAASGEATAPQGFA